MKSHETQFSPRDLLQLAAGPLLVAAAGAALLHAAAALGMLPAPRPTLDMDRTILIHQADAARHGPQADVVLIGDSSCLMGVSARQLTDALGRPVLNLATVSHLDLPAYGRLLSEFTRRHTPAAVVLLLHPEALRRLGPEPHPVAVLTQYLAGRDDFRSGGVADAFNRLSGADLISGRLLARALPSPLRGPYGAYYGFSDDLERFMTREHGSAVDPGSERFSGNAEYRLAPTLAKASQAFRANVPNTTRLLVGITPAPAGFAGPGYPAERDIMLRQWAEWLGPAVALTNLPATLPNDQMARVTHLKPEAIADYTRAVAAAVRPQLP